jgi:hypothetical protein
MRWKALETGGEKMRVALSTPRKPSEWPDRGPHGQPTKVAPRGQHVKKAGSPVNQRACQLPIANSPDELDV